MHRHGSGPSSSKRDSFIAFLLLLLCFVRGVIETTRRTIVQKIESLLSRPQGVPSRGVFYSGIDIMPMEL